MGRKKTKRVSIKTKPKPKQKFSLKKSKKRMISKKKYQQLIEKRQHNIKLTLNERKQLDHALFVNYCSCVKSLKYNQKVKDYLEYPICLSAVYKKRGLTPPKGVTAKCGKYKPN
jgi:hypothetical protein